MKRMLMTLALLALAAPGCREEEQGGVDTVPQDFTGTREERRWPLEEDMPGEREPVRGVEREVDPGRNEPGGPGHIVLPPERHEEDELPPGATGATIGPGGEPHPEWKDQLDESREGTGLPSERGSEARQPRRGDEPPSR